MHVHCEIAMSWSISLYSDSNPIAHSERKYQFNLHCQHDSFSISFRPLLAYTSQTQSQCRSQCWVSSKFSGSNTASHDPSNFVIKSESQCVCMCGCALNQTNVENAFSYKEREFIIVVLLCNVAVVMHRRLTKECVCMCAIRWFFVFILNVNLAILFIDRGAFRAWFFN